MGDPRGGGTGPAALPSAGGVEGGGRHRGGRLQAGQGPVQALDAVAVGVGGGIPAHLVEQIVQLVEHVPIVHLFDALIKKKPLCHKGFFFRTGLVTGPGRVPQTWCAQAA